VPAGIPAPLPQLLTAAQGRGFYFGGLAQEQAKVMTEKVLPQHGFRHVMLNQLSTGEDLHYPNFKPDWLMKSALPFLDDSAAAEAKRAQPAAAPKVHPTAATGATTTAPTAAAAPAKPAVSKAQRLLNMAQLYVNNGQRDLAKTKLQQLLADYPNDPVAPKAKQLLEQLSSP
jgi:TolA-binding protein